MCILKMLGKTKIKPAPCPVEMEHSEVSGRLRT